MSADERQLCKKQWQQIYNSGIEEDSWGHPVEASDAYDKLVRQIDQKLATPSFSMNQDERSILIKTKMCLKLRSQLLSDVAVKQEITLDQLKQLKTGRSSTEKQNKNF